MAMMSLFYYLHYSEEKDYEPYGVAYAPEEVDLFVIPVSGIYVNDWKEIQFKLKGGEFADYLANDLGGRLCSSKLREIVNENISPKDKIQWLNVSIINENKEERTYYILHFPVNNYILNKEKSLITEDGVVVKAVLDNESIKDLNIFTLPDESGITTFVSKKIKKIMEQSGCTGVAFSKVPIK
jgi:hypothetical protein